jgi:hypothetical protein
MKKPIRKPPRARMHERPILPVKVLTDEEAMELLKNSPKSGDPSKSDDESSCCRSSTRKNGFRISSDGMPDRMHQTVALRLAQAGEERREQ